jgi:chromosome segregation ATPase
MIGELKNELHHFKKKSARLEEELKHKSMEAEDYFATLVRNEELTKNFTDHIKELRWTIDDKEEQLRKKDGTIRGRDTEIDRLKDALQGAADNIKELNQKIEDLELKLVEGEPTPHPQVQSEVEKIEQEV